MAAGRFGLWVGFRENALSKAALSSYRGGLLC
ncbi:rCG60885 [Rattus norvegicus]|uniref:RCG60885 n=1 Tax=Rattus norvegicus TaxID=10116 RepID=A6JJW6_RAT|nr:rCG60885 [Rattus norvegicus]